MPGSNAGTGQPISFRCSQCRRSKYRRMEGHGSVFRVQLTGKKRELKRGGVRSSYHSRQYVCADCGHVGWSRHKDLERKAAL